MKRKKKSPEEVEEIILNILFKIYPIVFILWVIAAVVKFTIDIINAI